MVYVLVLGLERESLREEVGGPLPADYKFLLLQACASEVGLSLEEFERALESWSAKDVFDKALVALFVGDTEHALDLLEDVGVDLGDRFLRVADIDRFRGLALRRLGRFPEAAEAYRRAAEDLTGDPSLLVHEGNALLRQGEIHTAEQVLRRAVRLAAETFGESHVEGLWAQAGLAATLYAQERFQEAKEVLAAIRAAFESAELSDAVARLLRADEQWLQSGSNLLPASPPPVSPPPASPPPPPASPPPPPASPPPPPASPSPSSPLPPLTPGSEAPAAAEDTFSSLEGVWNSDFGIMALRQKGGELVGAYSCCRGRLWAGRMTGDRLEMSWSDPIAGQGTVSFLVAKDGSSLEGRWENGSHSAGGEWSAVRMAAASSKPWSVRGLSPARGPFGGTAKLRVDRSEVAGEWIVEFDSQNRSPQLEPIVRFFFGTVVQSRIRLRWMDIGDGTVGSMELTRQEGRLVGRWQEEDGTADGEVVFYPPQPDDLVGLLASMASDPEQHLSDGWALKAGARLGRLDRSVFSHRPTTLHTAGIFHQREILTTVGSVTVPTIESLEAGKVRVGRGAIVPVALEPEISESSRYLLHLPFALQLTRSGQYSDLRADIWFIAGDVKIRDVFPRNFTGGHHTSTVTLSPRGFLTFEKGDGRPGWRIRDSDFQGILASRSDGQASWSFSEPTLQDIQNKWQNLLVFVEAQRPPEDLVVGIRFGGTVHRANGEWEMVSEVAQISFRLGIAERDGVVEAQEASRY